MQQDQNEYPVDYLNQIAFDQKKSGMSNGRFFAIIGGGLAAAILLLIIVFSGGKPSPLPALSLRLESTLQVADDSQKIIQSSELRSINSNMITFLTNTSRELAAEIARQEISLKDVDETTALQESGADLSALLEDARLNAKFDSTYAREMDYRLETIHNLMGQSYEMTKSKKFKTFLNTTDDQLRVIQKQFSDFSDTN